MSDFYFLEQDYEALQAQIRFVTRMVIENGQEMGRSCGEGAETFHDNFAWEEGERQQRMWTRRLRELVHVRDRARVVLPAGAADRVCLGASVRYEDIDTGEVLTARVGSYMTFDGSNTMSYNSPIGRLLMGARAGEERFGTVGGQSRAFRVLEVR